MSDVIKPIKIDGLRQFQAALRSMEDGAQKELRVVLNSIADTVVAGAGRRVPTKTGRARASLKARSGQREAVVSAGSRKVPYYAWLDFGGRVGRQKTTTRPFVRSGRYLWPTIAANRQSLTQALQSSLNDLARRHGFEVT